MRNPGRFALSHAVFLGYLSLLFAHIAFLWWLPYFPTQDGPSHLYNLVVLRDLIHGGQSWGKYFDYRLALSPNMGFSLFAYPLLRLFPALTVEKIVLSIYVLLMGTSVPLLLRVFGKPLFPFSFFLFPVIFNTSLLMGFYSYVLAVPVFLFALAIAWSIRDRSLWLRAVVFNAAGIVLFCFHIIPFVFFLMATILLDAVEPKGLKQKINKALTSLVLIGPSILLVLLYLLGDTNGIHLDFSYLWSLSRIRYLLVDVLLFSTVSFLKAQLIPAVVVIYVIVITMYLSLRSIIVRRWKEGYSFRSDRFILALTACLMFFDLCSPNRFFGIGNGMFFNERFPWVILLVMLPAFDVPKKGLQRKHYSAIVVAVVSVFFVFNVFALRQKGRIVERYVSGIVAGLPEGAMIMGYKPFPPRGDRVDILLHAPSYYGILRGCVDLGNYEAKGLRYFPVRFKRSFPAIPPPYEIERAPRTIEWREFPAVEYLIAWGAQEQDREKIGKFFREIFRNDELGVWKRIHENQGAPHDKRTILSRPRKRAGGG